MTIFFSPKSYPSPGNVIQEKTLEREYLKHTAVHCNPLISRLKINSPEIQGEIFQLSLCERIFRNLTTVAAPGLRCWGLNRMGHCEISVQLDQLAQLDLTSSLPSLSLSPCSFISLFFLSASHP